MAKSKSFRTLRTDDMGNELVFDASAFKDCMSTMASELEKKQPKRKGAKKQARRELALFLWGEPIGENDKTIERWINGDNGPSKLEDVEKMEQYFGKKLLKKKHVEDTMINNTIAISETERNAAREVYTIISDLIRVHQKLMFNYGCAGCPNPIFGHDRSYIPENYPVFADIANEIRKRSLDIPRAVRNEALEMVYDIYGPWDAKRESEGDYPSLEMENEDFRLYSGADVHANNEFDFLGWLEFSNEQTESYYDQLDEIFEKYIN